MATTQGSAAVVVGGGLAGLTAAAYLARDGADVTLLEKAHELGGRAASRDRDGFVFHLGGHALYTGGATSRVLEDLDVAYGHGVPRDVSVRYGGELYPLPADPVGLLRSDLFDARDKLALFRFLAATAVTRPSTLGRVSVADWLRASVDRPRVQRLLIATARTFLYTTALDLVSADVFVDKFRRASRHPVHYVDGGWQVLIGGLRAAVERAGVRVLAGTAAERIEVHDGRVTGVGLRGGERLEAPAVVVATDRGDAAALLRTAGHTTLPGRLDALIPARVACLDVALERLPDPTHPIVADLDAPRFMSTQSVYARVAPEGAALIVSFKQLDPRVPSDPHADRRDLEALLDAVQPGWRDLVVHRRFLPAIDAVGALPTAPTGGFRGRPEVRVPGIAGLYLAGDWVGAEGFLADASTASAREAAASVLHEAPRAPASAFSR